MAETAVAPPPEALDPAARPDAATIIAETQGPMNTALNEKVSHELQGADAAVEVTALEDLRGKARIAEELAAYDRGEVTQLSEQAQAALAAGETSESMLEASRIGYEEYQGIVEAKDKPFEFEQRLTDARTNYIELLMKRPRFRGRKAHKEQLAEAEAAYNAALVDKIASLMEFDPKHRKALYVPATMEALQREAPDPETFSENHLHVLADQIAREHLTRGREIEERTNVGAKRVLNAFKNSRALRVVVGGALWAGGIVASQKGLLPDRAQFVGEGFEQVLPLVAGYFTSREVFNGISDGVESIRTSRQTKKDIDQITSDTFLTRSVLGTVYSGVEFQGNGIPGRQAGETKEDNAEAIGNIDKQFQQLQDEGARGGKPYTSAEIMPIVSDLYLRRKDAIDAVVAADNPKEAFLQLCAEVIADRTAAVTERQSMNRAKTAAFRALSLVSTALVGQWMGHINGLQKATSRPAGMLKAETV